MADDRHFQFYIAGAIDMLAWFLGWDDPTEASEEKLVALARGERETVQ